MPIVKSKDTYQSIEREAADFGVAMKPEQDEHHAVSHSKKILFLVGPFLLMAVMAFRSGAIPGVAALFSQTMEESESAKQMAPLRLPGPRGGPTDPPLGKLSDDAFVTQAVVEFGESKEKADFTWVRKGACGNGADWMGWFDVAQGGSARCAAACAEKNGCGYISYFQNECHLYNKTGDCPKGGASYYHTYRVDRLIGPKCIDMEEKCNKNVDEKDSTSCSNCCNPNPTDDGTCTNTTISLDYLKNKYPAIQGLNQTEQDTALSLYNDVANNNKDNHIIEFVTGRDPEGVKKPKGHGAKQNYYDHALHYMWFTVWW